MYFKPAVRFLGNVTSRREGCLKVDGKDLCTELRTRFSSLTCVDLEVTDSGGQCENAKSVDQTSPAVDRRQYLDPFIEEKPLAKQRLIKDREPHPELCSPNQAA